MNSDDRRKYENDVFYEAWSRGLDPDRAVQCADECYYSGRQPEECVDGYAAELRRARQKQEQEQEYDAYVQQEMERQYCEAMEERRAMQEQEHENQP